MNLRQKVKQAKVKLKKVEEDYKRKTRYGATTWDIVENYEITSKLQEIINHKRKFNRYYHWNEEHQIDWDNLTYISFHADYKTLGILKSPNGKPLKKEDVNHFLDIIMKTKFYPFAKEISKLEKNEKDYIKHIDYFVSVSNDRTKDKKLHMEKVYYQFKGDDKIYKYQKQKTEVK